MKWRPASEMPLQCCLLLCLALRAASSIRVVQGPSSRVLVDASAQRSTVAEPESIGTSAPLEPGAADELRLTAEEDRRFIGISPPMPNDLLSLWNQAAEAFGEFQREFVATGVISCNGKRKLEEAAVVLERLAQYALGAEREFILYGRLQDVYAPLARDDSYCAQAACWSLQRAVSPLGSSAYVSNEASESTCWNSAISSAITCLGLGPNMCGANVVVTILKLAAGARILPHCGVTNRRLIMQFALRGSAGVEFTVGDEKRGYGGDGHALVFDDSFEHEVWHGGDRYVILALLRHPDA